MISCSLFCFTNMIPTLRYGRVSEFEELVAVGSRLLRGFQQGLGRFNIMFVMCE